MYIFNSELYKVRDLAKYVKWNKHPNAVNYHIMKSWELRKGLNQEFHVKVNT